jgi:hypothetical protein
MQINDSTEQTAKIEGCSSFFQEEILLSVSFFDIYDITVTKE